MAASFTLYELVVVFINTDLLSSVDGRTFIVLWYTHGLLHRHLPLLYYHSGTLHIIEHFIKYLACLELLELSESSPYSQGFVTSSDKQSILFGLMNVNSE